MTTQTNSQATSDSQKPSRNPFSGWSIDDLSEATKELSDIVEVLSQRAELYTDNPNLLNKLHNLKEARNLRNTFRLCRKVQRDILEVLPKIEPKDGVEEYAGLKNTCAQTTSNIDYQINSLKETLADHKDSHPAPAPTLMRLGATTTILGGLYAVEMYLLFGRVLTKPFNDSKLAKVLYATGAAGVIYIGYKDEIDSFYVATKEIFSSAGKPPLPHIEAVQRISKLTVHKTTAANDPVRPSNHDQTLITRREILGLRFVPRR